MLALVVGAFSNAHARLLSSVNGDVGVQVASVNNERTPDCCTRRAATFSLFGDAGVEPLYLDLGIDSGRHDNRSGGGTNSCVASNEMREARFGVLARTPFELSRAVKLMPYVAGGGERLKIDLHKCTSATTGQESQDESWGYYVRGGLGIRWFNTFYAGVDYRALRGTHVTLFAQPTSADFNQIGVFVAWHWGEGWYWTRGRRK